MFTTNFKNLVMDHVFGGGGTSSLPATYYLGLSSTEMNADGGNVTEPSGYGYERVQVTFSASADGLVSNTNTIEFPKSTGSWGTLSYCVLFDGAGTGAKAVWCRPLNTPQAVSADNTLLLPIRELWLQFSEIDAGATP